MRYKNDASTISSPFIKSMTKKLEVLEKVEDQKGFLEVYLDLKGEIEFPKWINEYENVLKIAFLSDSRKYLTETPDTDSIQDMQAYAKQSLTSNSRGDGYITIRVPLYANELFMGDLIFWFSDSDLRIEEKQALLLVGWVLIFSMLFGGLLAWIISSAITKPINQLTLDTKSIATGSIDHKIYHLKSMDEIGALARSFHSMQDSIREKLNEVNEKNFALLNEINERKQAENQLTKFATVIEQADEEVLITDPEGTIQYVNPSFEKNTGYTKNDVLGQKPSILKSEIHNSEFYKNLWTTILNKKIWKGTIHNKCKNDQLILHDMTITPILDSNKEISAFVSIRRDITDRAKIEQQMILSQKMEAMGALAGGIAHDFNNILSGIFGFANLAQSNLDDPEKAKAHIEQVTKGARRATELVQQILTFSRKTEFQKSSIKLYLIIKEAIKFLRSSIPSNIEIEENIICREAALADPTQIHQIVMNLCTNAHHAMKETGGKLSITLEEIEVSKFQSIPDLGIAPGNYLRLEVSDTGSGMASETLSKIFEPYYTTKKIGEGTGLGLAVVLGIVEEHDGHIRAYSEIGKGSNFHIYFPILKNHTKTPEIEKKEETVEGGTEKIMVVDDEDSIKTSTQELLEDYGYKVNAFSNGTAAFKDFEKNPNKYDLIITDVTMPKMTGDELISSVLEIRNDIPVILCSGYSKDFAETKICQNTKYLQKPIDSQKLLILIRKILDKSSQDSCNF